MVGSGFEALSSCRGKYRATDALRYFGIYDSAIITVSGHVCIGFYVAFKDFNEKSGFIKFIHALDPSLESVHQVYCVYSKSNVLFFYFLTLPYPFSSSSSFLNILPKFSIAGEEDKWKEVLKTLSRIRLDVLSIFPNSQVLTDMGLNSFINLILNKSNSPVEDFRPRVFDDFALDYDSFAYNGEHHAFLKLKNFPSKHILSDLLFGQRFEFPFIINCTITKPTVQASNDIYFKEKDFKSQQDILFTNKPSGSLVGDNIFLTESTGDYVYQYDLKVLFFEHDLKVLHSNVNKFQSRMRDFGLIFSREEMRLLNSLTSFFPGLSFVFGSGTNILNADAKYLLPWNKDSYEFLEKEIDVYPEFVEEVPIDSDIVFSAPKIERGSGELAEGVSDEETLSKAPLQVTGESSAIGTKSSISVPDAIAPIQNKEPSSQIKKKVITEQPKSPENIEDPYIIF